MTRRFSIALLAALTLSACGGGATAPQLGADGKPLPRVYRIPAGGGGKIDYRVLDSVNSLRSAAGVGQLALNAQLNAAAETHSRDMSVQNRPWHFGSDGSSPLDRVARTGYAGILLGENISETYETELETLAAWMDLPDTRSVIMDPMAVNLGFGYYQDGNGKIWWTLLTGS